MFWSFGGDRFLLGGGSFWAPASLGARPPLRGILSFHLAFLRASTTTVRLLAGEGWDLQKTIWD